MDKKLKARWIKALRSGKFKQGSGALERIEGERITNCCLGVLCRVEKIKAGRPQEFLGQNGRVRQFHGNWGRLTNSLLRRFNLSDDAQEYLVNINDGHEGEKRRTFRGIATWIEKNL